MVGGLVASGLPADRFTALGVLPASQAERVVLWPGVAREAVTVVCEVRADDMGEVLEEIQAHLGDRRIAVARGGDVWRGRASQAEALEWSGTVTLAIEGTAPDQAWTRERVLAEVRGLLDAGASARDTIREVARRSGWPRRQVYELALLASRDTD
jgi:16S rRNA (cytidine1402-2'-O)-methyltransferase